MSFSRDSNKPEVEQQLAELRQKLEAALSEAQIARSERDEAISSLVALQKEMVTKSPNFGADIVMQNGAGDRQVVKSPQSTLQDSDHGQTFGREGYIRSVPPQGNLEHNGTSLKWQRRQLGKQILRRKVTKDMVQEAIKLYDLEKSYRSLSPR
jgi:hypothetical protein